METKLKIINNLILTLWIKRSKIKLRIKRKCGKISKKCRNIRNHRASKSKKKKKKIRILKITREFSFNIAYLKKSLIFFSLSLSHFLARIVKIITRNLCSFILFQAEGAKVIDAISVGPLFFFFFFSFVTVVSVYFSRRRYCRKFNFAHRCSRVNFNIL